VIRVVLPAHLRNLARLDGEVELELPAEAATIGGLIAAIEARYPMLRGTIREHGSLRRRAYVRYFACGEDVSFAPTEAPLPEAVVRGDEPFLVVGAMSGG